MPDRIDNLDELFGQITAKSPDIAEFRMDSLEDSEAIASIGRKKPLPAIAAHRAEKNSSVGRDLLLAAANSGFEYVDIDSSWPDAKNLAKMCKAAGAKIIASTHNFHSTPPQDELNNVLRSVKEIPADVYKIVTTATRPHDNLVVLNFLEDKCREAKLVSFAMGTLGIPSRILSPVHGAEFTFAALSLKSRTAEGQLTIDDLRGVWELLGIQ